ncbi:MAG: histidine phosphatase family protein [Leptolyngbyaceae cyanobacterium SM1_1_3]|nr:histidine phosphatase family protein [Leptolyngbyaceae cyanobacterium SM1_1_3]NJM84797.1 histidine phosphatase family protein [Leptolyngbyaceae cyanobacterium RM2_2_21]NJN01788.1 histidine phosphatase family protein [Leptolyngbyaceae cyanobacterium RM1_1_2]NJO09789.1 histidine phosphatase family protein [Leptolyngbyaceae cyanobacterium SL_1_1]
MPFLRLLFMRHAQSLGNQARQMEGQASSDLSARGQRQAQRLGVYLQAQSWQPTHIYSSPLQRALQTARILHSGMSSPQAAKIPLITTSDLQESHQGIFQGLTWVEAQQRCPQLCQQLLSSPDWIPVPGAESPEQVRQRACAFLKSLLEQHSGGDRLWVISHSGLLLHLIATLLGCDRSWQISIPNTSLFEFWIDCDRWDLRGQTRYNTGLWQIRRFNDCAHLPQLDSEAQTEAQTDGEASPNHRTIV